MPRWLEMLPFVAPAGWGGLRTSGKQLARLRTGEGGMQVRDDVHDNPPNTNGAKGGRWQHAWAPTMPSVVVLLLTNPIYRVQLCLCGYIIHIMLNLFVNAHAMHGRLLG